VGVPGAYNQPVQKPSDPIILADRLTKTYRSGKLEVAALRGVSFEVARGEFVSIVGPSGSGKSTLFYLLGGLTRATSGRVLIDGTDFASLDDAGLTRMRRTKIGFVFQRFNLLPTLSAMDNIEIAYEISGSKEPLDRAYLDHLADLLSIRGRLDHRPAELSGGEQQRVAIARALVTHPAIVLADEPTGNLDRATAHTVFELMLHLAREQGTAFVVVTHDESLAARCARVLRLEAGRLRD
jgi:putative ABC transport system ATP-binding protein